MTSFLSEFFPGSGAAPIRHSAKSTTLEDSTITVSAVVRGSYGRPSPRVPAVGASPQPRATSQRMQSRFSLHNIGPKCPALKH